MSTFLQLVVSGLGVGAGIGLLGIGLVLIFRTTGTLNFAQGTCSVLAALLMWSLLHHLPGLLAGLIAVGAAAVFGAGVAPLAMGLRGRRSTVLTSLIVTLGIALTAAAVELLIWDETPRTFGQALGGSWAIGDVIVQSQHVVIIAVTALVTILLVLFLSRTLPGQALLAVADSRRAAEVVGLNVRRLAILVYAIAGALGGLAGVLLAPLTPLSYESDISLGVNAFAAAAFGGLGSIGGAVAGGLILGVAQSLVAGYIDPQFQLTVSLVVLVGVMVIRAGGEREETEAALA